MIHGTILRPGRSQLIASYLFAQHSLEIGKARCIFLLEDNETKVQQRRVICLWLLPNASSEVTKQRNLQRQD